MTKKQKIWHLLNYNISGDKKYAEWTDVDEIIWILNYIHTIIREHVTCSLNPHGYVLNEPFLRSPFHEDCIMERTDIDGLYVFKPQKLLFENSLFNRSYTMVCEEIQPSENRPVRYNGESVIQSIQVCNEYGELQQPFKGKIIGDQQTDNWLGVIYMIVGGRFTIKMAT